MPLSGASSLHPAKAGRRLLPEGGTETVTCSEAAVVRTGEREYRIICLRAGTGAGRGVGCEGEDDHQPCIARGIGSPRSPDSEALPEEEPVRVRAEGAQRKSESFARETTASVIQAQTGKGRRGRRDTG